jgi:syntaxin 5
MISMKDRTAEFHAAVDTIKNRSFGGSFQARNLEHRRPLLSESRPNGKVKTNKSEFANMAAAIGRDINTTAGKLQKLTKCKLKLF